MKYSPLILFGTLVLFSATAFSQIYEWIDENGVKRYSNVAPPEDVPQMKQQGEIITETSERSSAPSNEQAPGAIKQKNAEEVKSKKQDLTSDDKKSPEVKMDTEESETVKRLKKALEKKTTSRTKRKLMRRLKAAEGKEEGKANKDK